MCVLHWISLYFKPEHCIAVDIGRKVVFTLPISSTFICSAQTLPQAINSKFRKTKSLLYDNNTRSKVLQQNLFTFIFYVDTAPFWTTLMNISNFGNDLFFASSRDAMTDEDRGNLKIWNKYQILFKIPEKDRYLNWFYRKLNPSCQRDRRLLLTTGPPRSSIIWVLTRTQK